MQNPIQKTTADSTDKKIDAKKFERLTENTMLINSKHRLQEIHIPQGIYY